MWLFPGGAFHHHLNLLETQVSFQMEMQPRMWAPGQRSFLRSSFRSSSSSCMAGAVESPDYALVSPSVKGGRCTLPNTMVTDVKTAQREAGGGSNAMAPWSAVLDFNPGCITCCMTLRLDKSVLSIGCPRPLVLASNFIFFSYVYFICWSPCKFGDKIALLIIPL